MNNQHIIQYIREAVESKYKVDNDLTRPDWNSVTMFIDGLEEFVGNVVEMPDQTFGHWKILLPVR